MKKAVLSFIVVLCSTSVFAQFSNLNKDLFAAQIHLVDEFMQRFNTKAARPNLPEEYVNDAKSNILLLFDLAKFKSKNDSLWVKAEEFANRVIEDSVQLHYEDTTWCAKALCRGMLMKKPVDFTLYLQVGKTAIGRYTWYIKKAEGRIFDMESSKKHKPFTLMPDDHETNFMSFYRMTDETSDYITDFISDGKDIDATTVFITLVKMNLLKIEYVKGLEFIFNQVPGYEFTINYVSRENLNAGWLISSFRRIGEQ